MTYQEILQKTLDGISKQKKLANKLTLVRLLFALIALWTFYQLFNNSELGIFKLIGVVSTTLFLFSVNYHQKLLVKIRYSEAICKVCKGEIAAEQGITEQFDGGKEYINPEHAFSLDLDIFGEKSVFQLLNRTFTSAGKSVLATQIQYPFQEKNTIEERQTAIEEVKHKIDFRVNFLANGQLLDENPQKFNDFKAWLKEDKLAYFKQFQLLLWLIPLVNIGLLGLWIADIIQWRIYVLVFLVETLVSFFTRRKISSLFLKIDRYLPKLEQYIALFKLIENEPFEAILLKKWQNSFINNDFVASNEINKLIVLGKYFDLRNTLFGPILNALFLWDYQCAYRLELWKQQNATEVQQSFDVLHELEAIISIACFAYANPTFSFPEAAENTILTANNLGHPLLNSEKRVCNDFTIRANEQLFIATGANMAGKSTFLRAVGVNLVLGMIGSPVCAEKMVFKPIEVFTCMRITDSIGEGESYFHAELLRLQQIVNLLANDKTLFVILDELLKGTNSKDKLLGSEMYLKKLLNYKNVWGLIATHDLGLTNMAKSYPDSIKNICFEVTISGNQMTFDYKLRAGVTQNMNALFLMNQMGIINLDESTQL